MKKAEKGELMSFIQSIKSFFEAAGKVAGGRASANGDRKKNPVKKKSKKKPPQNPPKDTMQPS